MKTTLRIVIVEDDSDLMTAMAARLRTTLSAEVITCGQGREALKALDGGEIDLFCVDLVLPDISGFEVITQLRNHPSTVRTPVLVVSGRTGLDERSRAAEVGATAFLEKPFALKTLLERVRAMLEVKS